MARYRFDGLANVDYPSLGFTAVHLGVAELPNAPDAHWTLVADGTAVTLTPAANFSLANFQEPNDGDVYTYSAAKDGPEFRTPTGGGGGSVDTSGLVAKADIGQPFGVLGLGSGGKAIVAQLGTSPQGDSKRFLNGAGDFTVPTITLTPGTGQVASVTDTIFAGGADPTGASDSSAAFSAALAASTIVYVPPGSYSFDAPIAPQFNPKKLYGAGWKASFLNVTANFEKNHPGEYLFSAYGTGTTPDETLMDTTTPLTGGITNVVMGLPHRSGNGGGSPIPATGVKIKFQTGATIAGTGVTTFTVQQSDDPDFRIGVVNSATVTFTQAETSTVKWFAQSADGTLITNAYIRVIATTDAGLTSVPVSINLSGNYSALTGFEISDLGINSTGTGSDEFGRWNCKGILFDRVKAIIVRDVWVNKMRGFGIRTRGMYDSAFDNIKVLKSGYDGAALFMASGLSSTLVASTTVGGTTLPRNDVNKTLTVNSTAGFDAQGAIRIGGAGGCVAQYTGLTATTFTGLYPLSGSLTGAVITAGMAVDQWTPVLSVVAKDRDPNMTGLTVSLLAGAATGFRVQVSLAGTVVETSGDCLTSTDAAFWASTSNYVRIFDKAITTPPPGRTISSTPIFPAGPVAIQGPQAAMSHETVDDYDGNGQCDQTTFNQIHLEDNKCIQLYLGRRTRRTRWFGLKCHGDLASNNVMTLFPHIHLASAYTNQFHGLSMNRAGAAHITLDVDTREFNDPGLNAGASSGVLGADRNTFQGYADSSGTNTQGTAVAAGGFGSAQPSMHIKYGQGNRWYGYTWSSNPKAFRVEANAKNVDNQFGMCQFDDLHGANDPTGFWRNKTAGIHSDVTDEIVGNMYGYWTDPVTNKRYYLNGTVLQSVDQALIYAPFSLSGTLVATVGSNRYYVNEPWTIMSARASVGTAPTGGPITVDIKKNGASIFGTTPANRPTIAASSNTAVSGVPDVVTLAAGDYITVDVTTVGTTVAGANLTVQVELQRV